MSKGTDMKMKAMITTVLLTLSLAAQAAEQPTNVVFILADDLGICDIGAYAQRFTGTPIQKMYYETPHLDRLVSEGMAFSQAYACQLCSPTRASLLTGKNAARVGMTTATPGSVRSYYNQGIEPPAAYLPQDAIYWGDKIKAEQALANGSTLLALPAGQPGDRARDEITLAEALKHYHSAFIGKWHLGGHGAKGWQPKDQGFEELSYFDAGGSIYFSWRKQWNQRRKIHEGMPQEQLWMGKTGQNFGKTYLTDELTEHAVQFLKQKASQKQKQPFFLYFCHFSVHTPIQAEKEDVAYFQNKPTRGWNGHDNPTYAAMVRALDDSVGRVLSTLEQTGLDDNTLVVFMSDNGGVMYVQEGPTDNAPFKGGKAMLFEGGIRVPLVFRWKGRIQAGQWCDIPVHAMDLFPTLLDLAGYDVTPYIELGGIDGRSFKGLLRDPGNRQRSYTRDTFYWHYPFNVIVKHPDDGVALAPHSAIRQGDYKLIHDWSGRLLLHNIVQDPFEKRDLSETMPDKTRALFMRLHDWLDMQVEVKYHPALNPNYRPEKETRSRPFIDLRAKYLGPDRAIRRPKTDPRLKVKP
ncbi:MAG: sulfatase [Planctomycetota bacterium]|jgi:arylsulfatase A-like enzyme